MFYTSSEAITIQFACVFRAGSKTKTRFSNSLKILQPTGQTTMMLTVMFLNNRVTTIVTAMNLILKETRFVKIHSQKYFQIDVESVNSSNQDQSID